MQMAHPLSGSPANRAVMPDDDAITKGSAAMRFIAGPLNKQLLQKLLGEVIESCTRVRAAVASASRVTMKLVEDYAYHVRALFLCGRFDHSVAVDSSVLNWLLGKASPHYDCKLVSDILHAKIIWCVDAGA